MILLCLVVFDSAQTRSRLSQALNLARFRQGDYPIPARKRVNWPVGLPRSGGRGGIWIEGVHVPPLSAGFQCTLEPQGITFKVSCANSLAVNRLCIVPSGLVISNEPIDADVDVTVAGAEVAGLNADGSSKIFGYLRSAGSGCYGKPVADLAKRRKSLSEIYLPPVSENPEASKGYVGHDDFAAVGQTLEQRFPTLCRAATIHPLQEKPGASSISRSRTRRVGD